VHIQSAPGARAGVREVHGCEVWCGARRSACEEEAAERQWQRRRVRLGEAVFEYMRPKKKGGPPGNNRPRLPLQDDSMEASPVQEAGRAMFADGI